MASPAYFVAAEADRGARLDVWLSQVSGLTRSQIQRLIASRLVLVNGKLPNKAGDRLKMNDKVEMRPVVSRVDITAEESLDKAKKLTVEIIAETSDYVVINKPAGLIVHPGAQVTQKDAVQASNTLAGWLLRHYGELWRVGEYSNRPGMVHRLDKDTSGLMVIARNQPMFDSLKQQFKDRTVEKKYTALVHGVIGIEHGVLNFPIDRGRDGRMVARPKMDELTLSNVRHVQPGRTACTEFVVLKRFVNFTLVEVHIYTGRMHQIRVHFFAYNHPVVGDPLYFNKKLKRDTDKKFGRLFLHAGELSFTDLLGERKSFVAELPVELREILLIQK